MAADLSGRTLRANPLYELVPFERLADAERQALADLEEDPATYGLLRPRDGAAGLTTKSADRDTALLFLTLREPGPLPSYVHRAFGQTGLQAVTRLVADGVLEIEEEGAFLSGAAALRRLTAPRERTAPGTRLAALSLSALHYGHTLLLQEPGLDPLSLAARLYGYNTWPLTPRWHRLLPTGEAARDWLGLGPEGPNRRRLDHAWSALDPSPGWLHWTHRTARDAHASGPTYKLYVSPAPDALADGFGAILDVLTAARPFQFKVGTGAQGLLRPDKIVAYFPAFEPLAEAAATASRLSLPAQGVPFTAEIAGDGLLSWGIDPPDSRESWRFWLLQRLARALLSSQGSPPEVRGPARPAQATGRAGGGVEGAHPKEPSTDEPGPGPAAVHSAAVHSASIHSAAVHFALERLRLEGVDTDTWTPGALLWKADP